MSPSLSCECKGWDRQTCKHTKSVEKALSNGAVFVFPITFRSLTDPRKVYSILDGTTRLRLPSNHKLSCNGPGEAKHCSKYGIPIYSML